MMILSYCDVKSEGVSPIWSCDLLLNGRASSDAALDPKNASVWCLGLGIQVVKGQGIDRVFGAEWAHGMRADELKTKTEVGCPPRSC